MKRSALVGIMMFAFLYMMLPFNPTISADPTPEGIGIEVDHDVADTWSSVSVIIDVPLTHGENNSTYYTSRNVTLTLTDLDTPEQLVSASILAVGGIATYNFRILPDWGECLLEVYVFDPQTATHAQKNVKVEYSIEYVIYTLNLAHDADVKEINEDNEQAIGTQLNLTMLMFVFVFVTLPIALLRLDHKTAKSLGKSSFWDKIQDKWFNYTVVPPSMWHYLEDPSYDFPTKGKRSHAARKLGYALEVVEMEGQELGEVRQKLKEQIEILEEGNV